ncbi:acylphosphatase [Bhargavaea beijingensis]|uniref:acylphosphatase n=1 Tax=Bhargavaea beijingensis TaxID=426756 RepID=UPI002225A16C|nr:acylphosphatase [Bhargavaea beijingensis]MCW1928849.1 acylphosphatase [Bhargavaea beijingensis]
MNTDKDWLPHLSNEMMIGARNNNLCSYLIALEGWRRGLKLTFYSRRVKQDRIHAPGCLFTLSSGENTQIFYKSRGMKVKGKAFSIGDNKFLAKKHLEKNGVQVPVGEKFSKQASDSDIIDYANKLGYPVVLKPAKAAQGKGVIANIESESFLIEALNYVRNSLGYHEVILEQFVEGKEYRVYVMEDKVVAVLNRRPANIVGDGVSTIKELIHKKNQNRKKNPRLYSCLIKIDFEVEQMIKKAGYSLNDVPSKNEVVFLREKSNITSGGDSIDVTDDFPDHIKEMAVKALKSVPDFPHGGVDMIIDPNKPIEKSAFVIELTPVPQIGSLVFPMHGKGRDVPSAIIDYYFPETKIKTNNNPHLYFNFKEILAPLNSKSAEEITVTPAPTYITHSKQYIIRGKVQNVGFRRWVRKKALEADLSGFAQNQSDGTLSVVVAGTEQQVNDFKNICETGPKASQVHSVIEKDWKRPIKVGFEIKENKKKNRKQSNLTKKTHPPKKQKKTSIFIKMSKKLKAIR